MGIPYNSGMVNVQYSDANEHIVSETSLFRVGSLVNCLNVIMFFFY